MKCITCKENELVPWEGEIEIGGVDVFVRGMSCSRCKEGPTLKGPELARAEKLAAATLIDRGLRSGKEFKFVRKVAGLKASDVADYFGVSAETISRWENDEREIPKTAKFSLGELYTHPVAAKKRFTALV